MFGRRSRHVTIPCAKCGAAAAEITLMPAQPTGQSQSLWHDRDRIERTEFLRHVYKIGRWAQLADLFEAIIYNNWDLARTMDADFVGFVCKICDLPYCEECWTTAAQQYAEEQTDCTWGTCPHEHVQIIDN
jgi:hypothetical protein